MAGRSKKALAADALRITAKDLSELGCIDGVVPEPEGGAHRDHEAAGALLDEVLRKHLSELKTLPIKDLIGARYSKFRNMAQFFIPEGELSSPVLSFRSASVDESGSGPFHDVALPGAIETSLVPEAGSSDASLPVKSTAFLRVRQCPKCLCVLPPLPSKATTAALNFTAAV